LGDAVYELWVREEAICHSDKSQDLHRFTTARVNADTQARLLEELSPTLSELEMDLIRRAQNMPVPASRRSNQAIYRKATAFEALVGWWYLTLAEEQLNEVRTKINKAYDFFEG
jgi:ribonuclease-3 family protein